MLRVIDLVAYSFLEVCNFCAFEGVEGKERQRSWKPEELK
jgi:hypothetical protein